MTSPVTPVIPPLGGGPAATPTPISPAKLGKSMMARARADKREIKIDTEALADAAAALTKRADELEAWVNATPGLVTKVTDQARIQGAPDPAPLPAEGTTAIGDGLTALTERVRPLIATLRADAGALKWIAQQNEESEAANAAKVTAIDTNGVGA